MGQVRYRLYKTFHHLHPNFIQQQGKRDGEYKSSDEPQATHSQRISKHEIESVILKQSDKVLESYPFLFEEALSRFVILKSHGPAPQGQVLEHQDP
ncbi:hypothetical protein D3C77_485700 [compost metagenome]